MARHERVSPERTNPHRTAIALAVLAAIAVVLALGIPWLWRLSNETATSTLSQAALKDAVAEASDTAVPDVAGYAPTGHEVETILVATVDDVAAEDAPLAGCALVSIDMSDGSVVWVSVPLDVYVTTDNGPVVLGELGANGVAPCVNPLSISAGLAIAHVVELDPKTLETLESAASEGMDAMASKATELVSSMGSDLGVGELATLALDLSDAAVNGIQRTDCPLDEGATIDQGKLGALVGTLAPN